MNRRMLTVIAFICAALFLWAPLSLAKPLAVTWTGGVDDNNWSAENNWDYREGENLTHFVPNSDSYVEINNGTARIFSDDAVAGSLCLGYSSGDSGNLELSSQSLSVVGTEVIGGSGSGTFTQTGGTHTVGESLYLGNSSGGSGTYNLSDGSLTVHGSEYIGLLGCGAFIQTDGTHTVDMSLILGAYGNSGTYDLRGGSLSAGSVFLYEGGTFTQSGGILDFTSFNQAGGNASFSDLYLGRNTDSSSTYNLNGGNLTASNQVIVGDAGTGAFVQDGGISTVTNAGVTAKLILGNQASGSGNYTLNSGSLTADVLYVGNAGIGTFTQNGVSASVNVANLVLGNQSDSQGTYELHDGTLQASALTVGQAGTGYFTQYGGALNSDMVTVGAGAGGKGAFTQSGGTHTISNLMTVGQQDSTGTYTIQSNAMLNAKAIDLGQPRGTGTLDLQDNATLTVTDRLTVGVAGDSDPGYPYGIGIFNQSGGTATVNQLVVGQLYRGLGYYNLSGGSMTADGLTIGDEAGSGGNVSVGNGASLTVNHDLVVGNFGGGYVEQIGGTVKVGGDLYIHYHDGSNGIFAQSGGSNTVTGRLYVGYDYSPLAEYNLSGNGQLTVSTAEIVGNIGYGTFTQGDATSSNTTPSLILGSTRDGYGTYCLNDGALNVTGDTEVGSAGTGTFIQTGGTHTVGGSLILGYNWGSYGTYYLQGGSLSAASVYLHEGGVFTQSGGTLDFAAFNQAGGSASFTDLYLGRNAGSSSTYILSGGSPDGSLTVSGSEYIGLIGSGTFTQTAGTHTVSGSLSLGEYSGSGSGTYDLRGGSLSAASISLNDGSTFTQSGGILDFTAFNQTGGSASFTDLYLGRNTDSSSTYTLNGGNLTASNQVIVGDAGTGVFVQDGGISTVTNAGVTANLILGNQASGSGNYTLNGGSLTADVLYVGNAGTGTFFQNGSSTTVNVANLVLGNQSGSQGTYELDDGTLQASALTVGQTGTGYFTQYGGNHTVGGSLILGYEWDSNGTYDLRGGSLVSGNAYVGFMGSGTFTQSGGTHTAGDMAVGYNGTGTVNHSGGNLSADSLSVNNGEYNLSGSGSVETNTLMLGGVFNQTGGQVTVSNYDVDIGEVNHSGGTVNASSMTLGYWNAGATYNLSGTASLTLDTLTVTQNGILNLSGDSTLAVGNAEVLGGMVNQTGGAANFAGLMLAGSFSQMGGQVTVWNYDVSGGVNHSGGNLSADSLSVGCNNYGEYNLSGSGSVETNTLMLGGVFNQTGGQIMVLNNYDVCAGEVNHSSGSLLVGNTLTVGNYNYGAYNLSGSGSVETNALILGGDVDEMGGHVFFNQTGGQVTVANNYDVSVGEVNHSGGTVNASSMTLGGLNSAGATYNLSGSDGPASLTLDTLTVNRSGTFNLSDDSTLSVGDIAQVRGGAILHGGGQANLHYLSVGQWEDGTPGAYQITGGSLSAELIVVGGYSETGKNGIGTLTVAGSGTLTVQDMVVGETATHTPYDDTTYSYHGLVTQHDGQVNVLGNLVLGKYGDTHGIGLPAIGVYELNGGQLNVTSDLSVGGEGQGIFKQTGGSVTVGNAVGNALNIGAAPGSSGAYTMDQGSLQTLALNVGSTATGPVTGYFTQNGGDVQVGAGGITNQGEIKIWYPGSTFTNAGNMTNYAAGVVNIKDATATLGQNVTNDGEVTMKGIAFAAITGNLTNNTSGTVDVYSPMSTATILSVGGNVTNSGSITIQGTNPNNATLSVGTAMTNDGTVLVNTATLSVGGDLTNNGTMQVTNAIVNITGTYTGSGAYISDPSINRFGNVVVTGNGYFVGGPGDVFEVEGDFVNQSTNNVAWNTEQAILKFVGDGPHTLTLPSAGETPGYANNFAWGVLDLTSLPPGESLTLIASDGSTGGALYVYDIIGLELSDGTITNLVGFAGLNLYYDPTLIPELAGGTFTLGDGTSIAPLAPVPLPGSIWLLLSGLAGLGFMGRRRKEKKN
jgi:hypothetical protein